MLYHKYLDEDDGRYNLCHIPVRKKVPKQGISEFIKKIDKTFSVLI